MQINDGVVLMGFIRNESRNSLSLELPGFEVRLAAGGVKLEVPRKKIQALHAAPVSLMPAGLDGIMTEAQLLDIVAYLESLR